MTTDDQAMNDAARTLRVIVQAEQLVVDLEAHTDLLARFIEEERRATRKDSRYDDTHGG